jgi:hypothetical protein
MLLVLLESPKWVHVYWGDFIKFRHVMWEYCILNDIIIKYSRKSDLKFFRKFMCALVLLEIPQWIGFYGGNFVKFRLEMHEILSFELFWSLKIQLNYKNWFWKEKNVGWVHTWATISVGFLRWSMNVKTWAH